MKSAQTRGISPNFRRELCMEALEDRTLLSNGIVTLSVTGTWDGAWSSFVNQDDQIVIGGRADSGGDEGEFLVARVEANGILDSTFGTNGLTTTDLNSSQGEQVEAVLPGVNGKVIAVGSVAEGNGSPGQIVPHDFAAVRYLGDGSKDNSYGNGKGKSSGIATVDFGTSEKGFAGVVLPDSGVVMAGGQFLATRLDASGLLDTSFGNNGSIQLLTGDPGFIEAVALQGNNIIYAGRATGGVFLARTNLDGQLDPTFGTNGIVIHEFGLPTASGSVQSYAEAVAIDADNNIVVAGYGTTSWFSTGENSMLVARFLPDGDVDTDFGTNGRALFTQLADDPSENTNFAHAVIIQSDGKIVAGGHNYASDQGFALVRLNDDGSVDTDFGNNGGVRTPIQDFASIESLALQSDSKIVATGSTSSSSGRIVALARYNPDGSLDTTFGSASTSNDDLYVWDIVFESRDRGNKHDERIAITIRGDSDSDGVSEASDAVVAGADVTVVLSGPTGGTFTGTTDSNGVFRTDWFRDVPDGTYVAEVTALSLSGANWNQDLDPTGNDTDLDSDNLPDQEHVNPDDHNLMASSMGSNPNVPSLTRQQIDALAKEVVHRLEQQGLDVTALTGIDFRVLELSGATLGRAEGRTIWLDADAAGHGWFIDDTPWDDSEFTLAGDQGEEGRIDLLTTIAHEVGHLLGYQHDEQGLMQKTLSNSIRELNLSELDPAHIEKVDALALPLIRSTFSEPMYEVEDPFTSWSGSRDVSLLIALSREEDQQ